MRVRSSLEPEVREEGKAEAGEIKSEARKNPAQTP